MRIPFALIVVAFIASSSASSQVALSKSVVLKGGAVATIQKVTRVEINLDTGADPIVQVTFAHYLDKAHAAARDSLSAESIEWNPNVVHFIDGLPDPAGKPAAIDTTDLLSQVDGFLKTKTLAGAVDAATVEK